MQSVFDVHILGGGISGLTTALVLQALGLRVSIVSEDRPLQNTNGGLRSTVPTEYAMASAYPHLAKIEQLEKLTITSQAVFAALLTIKGSGINNYNMFEVFEQEPETAALSNLRRNYQSFEGVPRKLKNTINPPARPHAQYLWGWKFETYFADMPIYLPFLWSLYKARGGQMIQHKLTRENFKTITAGHPLVNCLGVGALGLFEEPLPINIQRGRQVLVKGARLLKIDRLPAAYNYTPTADAFRRNENEAEYLHFFPRSDGWLLGQTREPGHLDEKDNWIGQAVQAPEQLLGDQLIPTPIIDLNRQILKDWCGVDLSEHKLIGRSGYRFYRDPGGDGARQDVENIDGSLIVHNYGHGGSGVTISWGCAINAARRLLAHEQLRPRHHANAIKLDQLIARLAREETGTP